MIGISTLLLAPAGVATGIGQNAGVGLAIPINAVRGLLSRRRAAGGGVAAPRRGITAGLTVQGPGQPVPVGDEVKVTLDHSSFQ